MKNLYDFFNKWKIDKIIFWYRLFAYSFFVVNGFKIKAVFTDYSYHSSDASAVQITQLASEGMMRILVHLSSAVTVGLVLIALEIHWAGKRKEIKG